MINLAQIAPNQNAYSETFIQNHKKHFDANVKFYYGGYLPTHLEGEGYLGLSRCERLIRTIKRYIFKYIDTFNDQEKALINSFQKHEIDIVFAEFGPVGATMTKICKHLQLPLIVNFHGADAFEETILKKNKESYEEMFKYASKVIAVSKLMYDKLLKLGCPNEKLEYITYGPEDIFLDIQPTFKENSFLAVGRFVDKKAPYYTILALKEVIEKYPDAKLYMAGDGYLFNTCFNIAKYLHLDKNIIFLGVVNHEELLPYYGKVKAFVQHSITALNGDTEGTPVGILEASAAGIPVVSTRHAGIPDIIIDGETGLLAYEHDIEGMAQNMIYILDNIEKTIDMGKSGKKHIMNNFSMEIQMKSLNKIISDIYKSPKR